MKNSALIFILAGGFIVVALIIGYIYIPNLDRVNGTQTISNLFLELPIKKMDLRYIDGGMVPFCNNGMTKGIAFEVKPNAQVYASTQGTVTKAERGMVEVKPENSVAILYENLSSIQVAVGDFVTRGSSIGSVENKVLLFSLLNINDNIYECPYTYLSEDAKDTIDLNFEYSKHFKSDICGCNFLSK